MKSEERNQCPHCGYWKLASERCKCQRDYVPDLSAILSARTEKSATAGQVGGSHYKDMAIQPAEYTTKNGIGHLAGDAIAYISRYRAKNGKEDLQKAIHSIQLLIELEYG